MPATDLQARILARVRRAGGWCYWHQAASYQGVTPDFRRAVAQLVAAGALVEDWLQREGGRPPAHVLRLPDHPVEGLPGPPIRAAAPTQEPARSSVEPNPVPRATNRAAASPPARADLDGIACPWCHTGRIILHAPADDWWVVEEGENSEGREGYLAGLKRCRFRTPPVAWFECSACSVTGTRAFLVWQIAYGPTGPARRRPAVAPSSPAAALREVLPANP